MNHNTRSPDEGGAENLVRAAFRVFYFSIVNRCETAPALAPTKLLGTRCRAGLLP
jgi:hypothetical protein